MQTFWYIFRLRILPALAFFFRHVVPIGLWFVGVYLFAMLVLPMVAVAWLPIAILCTVLAILDRTKGAR
ncbi:MAG: hypothetical protein HY645_13555 [Acidobacteria bacterium]|nr:hypothetical protein [Acidobacteriota bacterium]